MESLKHGNTELVVKVKTGWGGEAEVAGPQIKSCDRIFGFEQKDEVPEDEPAGGWSL